MDIYPPGSNKPYNDINRIKDEYKQKNKIIVVNKPSYVSIDPSDYPKSYFQTSNQTELRDNSPKTYISNKPKPEFPGNLAYLNMYNIPYDNPYKDYPSRPLISDETKKDFGVAIGIGYADSMLGKYIPDIPKLPKFVNSFIKGIGYIGTAVTGYSMINADSNAERIGLAIGFITGIAASFIFGVNAIVGAAIGFAAGYLAEKITDFFSNRSMTDDDKNGAGILPGVHPGGGFGDGDGGPGGPGGVEFRNVKPIKGIDSPDFVLSRTMNIFFNAENDADLIKVFNSFCLPNFQNRRVNEYFETIMREVSDGICITDELPFVSLHFNEDHLLYSVMNSYYKNTLIGNILAFLDYFLKGFVNGGFFDIDFIYEWLQMPYKKRLTDLSILNQKLISVRKSLKKIGYVNYKSLHDTIDRKKIGNDLSSAFRIIGKLKTIGASENILFPNESFSVEYDIHPSARMQKSLASKDKNSKSFPNIVFNYFQMKEMIKTTMPKVPEFRGFFVALDMITFAIHYNSSLHSNGKEIDTSNSFQNTGKQCDYVKIIPDVFPPLPVSIRKEVDVDIFTWEMIEVMQGTCLNKEIENILMNQKDDFSKNGINEICIKIEKLYRNKIYSSISEDSHYYDDDEIFLNDVLRTLLLFFTQDIPKIIKQFASHELSSLRKNVPKVNKEEKGESINQIPIESMDVSQIEEECANVLLLITNFVKNKIQLMNNDNKKLEELIISQKEKLSNDEKIIKDGNFINSEENQRILGKNRQIIANNENALNNNIKAKEEFETNNLNFIKVHKEQVNNLSKLLHEFSQNYKEILENKQYFHINYFLQKPTIVTDYDGSSIIGGCTINISKQSQINYVTKSAQQISEILAHLKANSSNQFIECSNGSKGFVINLKINSIPIDGNRLKLLKINDINRKDNVWINNFHQSHFLSLSGACSLLNQLSKDQCNEKTKDGKTPIYMACSSGNVSMIDTLCRKGVDFNNSNPNYIKPFLAAIMNGNRKAVHYLLLNNNIDIGDINQCTETGITPLHWAIYHNFPEVVELLLKKGASINSTLKLNGMTSVHLACFHNRPECLSLLIKSEGCDFTKSEAGQSPIHVAIAHSLHCSYMLIELEKCDLNEKDSHDYTTYDIAVINGQYEIANLLPKEGKMNDLLKKIKPSSNKEKSNRFLDICKKIYSGNYIAVKKLLFKQENQMKFTDDQKMELIDYACQGRCVEFVEILSKIIKFENYPILSIKSAHYGLLKWIPEIEKYGGKLLVEIDENTIFDESVANSDYDYLSMAFKYVDLVPIHILKRIVKKSIEINNVEVMNVISESIMPEKKFFLLLTGDDIFFSFTKVDAIQIYHKNLDPKYNIKLNSLIELISYNLIDYLVANNKFSHDDLKSSIVKALTIGKNDIAFLIIEKNPLIVDDIIKENSNLLKITKLTNENHIKALNALKTIVELDFKLPENEKITIFQNSFKNILDYGDILYGYNSLTWLAGQSIDFLWILKVLPKMCLEDFYLDNNAFEINKIELLFQKLISIYEILFDHKNIGFEFIKSLRKLKIDSIKKRGLANEFISAIFNIINTYGFNSFDDNNQNLIHLISKFSSIKKENRQKFIDLFQINETKNLLSLKTKNGETLILLLASSGNYKLLNELRKIGADFNVRDNKGNNVLHKILDGNFTTSNLKVISEISNICKYYPQLILQNNRNDENPFILAAKKGFNGVLGLMSTFYPVKILDSSPKYSILHIAAMYNHPETIRYIVQVLHVDINIKSKDGLTPLHYSSICNSVLSFKELLSLGGNPLITNNLNNMNAIDYAFKYGSNSMINAVIKTASFNISLSSPKILIYMAMNSEAYKIFEKVLFTMDKSSLFICDSNGNNLISIACITNNRKIVSYLLYTDLDPESVSFDGQNSIHVCAENNSIGCSDLILNHIKFNKTIKEVKSILCKCDLNGDLPIHIAIRNGYSGFLVHLLSVYCDKEILATTNNSEMTPFDEIIKCGLKKEAGILTKYATDILNMTLDEIEKLLKPEYKSTFNEFMKSEEFHSGEIIAYNIDENLWKYDLETIPESIQMKKDEDNITKIEIFVETLKESGVQIDESIVNRLSAIFNNFSFKFILLNILNEEGKLIVNDIINQASKINSLKIRNISCLMFLPKLENGSMMKNLLYKIAKLDELNIEEAHPVFSWIENGLISIAEAELSTDSLFYYIDKTIDFISLIASDKDLFNTIEYPVLPVPIHEFASFIMNLEQKNLIPLQINFAHLIHVSNIWRKKYTFSIDFCNRIGNEQNCLFEYAIENKFDINTLKRVIQVTLDLYGNPNLDDDLRQLILNHCKMLIEKSKESRAECLKTQISVFILNSMKVVQYYDDEYFKKIIKIIPQTSLSTVNEFLSLLLIIGSPTIATIDLIKKGIQSLQNKVDEIERAKFVENRGLTEILNAFKSKQSDFIPYKFAFDGTPVVTINDDEIKLLKTFGQTIKNESKIIYTKDQALERGKMFRDNPNIENAAKLVGFVRQVIKETLGINPFVIQCLAVGSLLLHRINKKNRNELKGRIAQIATGEGKSIIIAMLAGCVALTGSCVDIISSSFYLAERDAKKFKEFYNKLGLSCGTVHENNYHNGFDFHILYSTNTGFEFALLREGINGESMIETTLLYDNNKKHRPRMTVIVDEADNLFIDTSLNSARIAKGGDNKLSWIFKQIYDEVKNGNYDSNMIRKKLNDVAKNNQLMMLNTINDDKLLSLIKYAKIAEEKRKDVDYIIGRNKDSEKLEIQIVDAENTGRIKYGSRWSNGLHEFIEVKENLPVQQQSLTIASISHPSFFEHYEEIYGLTGTLGEELERNEIKNIYHVDSFDVPPNRKCQRIRERTLIVKTEKKKNEIIINKIRQIISSGRPILIIVQTIEESQKLSDLLHNEKIKHMILNDQQTEDEDFIVDRAGLPGSVTVATNTAGRGTDICIDKTALNNGGLHTLIAFKPANLRVECQALGRSGRQGQPGSCQIIFSSEVFGDDNNETNDDILDLVYKIRTNEIKQLSSIRMNRYKHEKKLYGVLKCYFDFVKKMKIFLDLPESKLILQSYYPDINKFVVMNDLDCYWAEYFTEIALEDNINEFSFEMFLEKSEFDKKYKYILDSFYKKFGTYQEKTSQQIFEINRNQSPEDKQKEDNINTKHEKHESKKSFYDSKQSDKTNDQEMPDIKTDSKMHNENNYVKISSNPTNKQQNYNALLNKQSSETNEILNSQNDQNIQSDQKPKQQVIQSIQEQMQSGTLFIQEPTTINNGVNSDVLKNDSHPKSFKDKLKYFSSINSQQTANPSLQSITPNSNNRPQSQSTQSSTSNSNNKIQSQSQPQSTQSSTSNINNKPQSTQPSTSYNNDKIQPQSTQPSTSNSNNKPQSQSQSTQPSTSNSNNKPQSQSQPQSTQSSTLNNNDKLQSQSQPRSTQSCTSNSNNKPQPTQPSTSNINNKPQSQSQSTQSNPNQHLSFKDKLKFFQSLQ